MAGVTVDVILNTAEAQAAITQFVNATAGGAAASAAEVDAAARAMADSIAQAAVRAQQAADQAAQIAANTAEVARAARLEIIDKVNEGFQQMVQGGTKVAKVFGNLNESMEAAIGTATELTSIGLSIGKFFGPEGAIIGAFVGLAVGAVTAFFEKSKADSKEFVENMASLDEEARALNETFADLAESTDRAFRGQSDEVSALQDAIRDIDNQTQDRLANLTVLDAARREELENQAFTLAEQLLLTQKQLEEQEQIGSTLQRTGASYIFQQEATKKLKEKLLDIEYELEKATDRLAVTETERLRILREQQDVLAKTLATAAKGGLDAIQKTLGGRDFEKFLSGPRGAIQDALAKSIAQVKSYEQGLEVLEPKLKELLADGQRLGDADKVRLAQLLESVGAITSALEEEKVKRDALQAEIDERNAAGAAAANQALQQRLGILQGYVDDYNNKIAGATSKANASIAAANSAFLSSAASNIKDASKLALKEVKAAEKELLSGGGGFTKAFEDLASQLVSTFGLPKFKENAQAIGSTLAEQAAKIVSLQRSLETAPDDQVATLLGKIDKSSEAFNQAVLNLFVDAKKGTSKIASEVVEALNTALNDTGANLSSLQEVFDTLRADDLNAVMSELSQNLGEYEDKTKAATLASQAAIHATLGETDALKKLNEAVKEDLELQKYKNDVGNAVGSIIDELRAKETFRADAVALAMEQDLRSAKTVEERTAILGKYADEIERVTALEGSDRVIQEAANALAAMPMEAVTAGFGAMFDAIEEGTNAIEAFGKAFARVVADVLKSTGTQLAADGIKNILIGGAMTIVGNPQGPVLAAQGGLELAAGLAMGATGAFLGRAGGGQGAGAGAAGGGGGGGNLGRAERERAPTTPIVVDFRGAVFPASDLRAAQNFGDAVAFSLGASMAGNGYAARRLLPGGGFVSP